ncbi:MAG: hypothetical protein ACK40V_02855 [Anaerolineales bacterium]
MTKIILLDIDGVLVQPFGYRAALRAAVKHFLGTQIEIEEDVLTDLEKRGISSEWDMTPLIIASYWNAILIQRPNIYLPDDVSAAAQLIKRIQPKTPIEITIPHFDLLAGQYPSDSALQANCFSAIPFGLRKNLLSNTRSVKDSAAMRIFQHFTLGSKHFAETYQLPAEIESESYLLKYDKSNISDEIKERLLKEKICIFTARPSGIPSQITEATVGYAPEAELALELAHMQNIPCIAFGKLEYLASQYQIDAARLVKPAAFQALAAAVAAYTGDEWLALQAAHQKNFSTLPKSFKLIVVEDTLGGIRSAQSAAETLQSVGFDVNVKAIGLSSGIKAKASAFEKAGIKYFENWEDIVSNIEN